MFKKFFLLFIFLFLFCPISANADIGVGISNGKIVINEKLKPGAIYKLPDVVVFNTGTEITDYEVNIQYNNNQAQLKPKNEWFKFSPHEFTLPSKGSQKITANLTVPVNAAPGEYFAFIDAHPLVGSLKGTTAIGVAAGAKVYFTIVPANFLTAIYYRFAALFTQYAPWSYILVLSLIIILFVSLFGKKFKIQIGIRKKND